MPIQKKKANIEDKITITPLFIAKFLPNNLNPRIKRGIFIRRVDKPILKLNNLLIKRKTVQKCTFV